MRCDGVIHGYYQDCNSGDRGRIAGNYAQKPQKRVRAFRDVRGISVHFLFYYVQVAACHLRHQPYAGISEFSANLCKDAGYQAVAGQIEMFGKLSILAISMPVILVLLETIGEFLV